MRTSVGQPVTRLRVVKQERDINESLVGGRVVWRGRDDIPDRGNQGRNISAHLRNMGALRLDLTHIGH